ncbi:sigma-70 family RNA polymerase sigma factor [Ascidiimonas aurantiaca]|uniref:RNA polymerase sigma factor n=1 Tax=Ascidiimonas aurantiaca TaxID=1685432 RepID=UPI0030ECFB50
MTNPSDQHYIDQTLQGHTDAFAFLVKEYEDMVFTIARKLLKDTEEAEDMAQEAFIKAFRALPSYKGDARFSTWLYRITYNLCLDRLKKKKKLPVNDLDVVATIKDSSEDALSLLEDIDRKMLIKSAIAKLTKKDQLLITLYYYEELSLKEIKEVTGLKENLIKIRLYRSRKKLLEILKGKEAILKL